MVRNISRKSAVLTGVAVTLKCCKPLYFKTWMPSCKPVDDEDCGDYKQKLYEKPNQGDYSDYHTSIYPAGGSSKRALWSEEVC